jgi:antitoxin HigA-1
MSKWRDPIHPGEILQDELEAIGMTGIDLATKIKVPKNRVYEILRGKRGITADTALRLGLFFGTTPDFWLNLQKAYELDIAKAQSPKSLKSIIPYRIAYAT